MKIRVGLFFGGRSVEHEVSVISALQALQNIDAERFDIIPIYISKQGGMYTGDDVGAIENYRDIDALIDRSTQVTLAADRGHVYVMRYQAKKFGTNRVAELDVALPIVHGTNCEDGALQGFFNILNLPYCGCDILSSAVGMDKMVQKLVLKQAGIPVLDALTINRLSRDSAPKLVDDKFVYPVIVKPVNLGSSVGISIAKDKAELRNSLDLAFKFADKVLVEPAITELKEVNCAVLGDSEEARPSECEEPIGADEILSYTDKYMRGGKDGGKSGGMASLGRKIPADITDEQRKTVQTLAVNAFQALGCAGVARLDFLLDRANDKIYFNEINTIPGSLAFYLWQASGISYKEMLSEMIEIALKRARRERSLTFSFDTNLLETAKLGGTKGTKA